MKKRVKGRAFGRTKDQRKALLIGLARALVKSERIQTTEAKAKEVAPYVEKMITKAKKGDLHARRQLIADLGVLGSKKIIEEIAPRYKDRAGGYTSIIKLGKRNSDSASMASLSLVI
ncbi:MAG: 50S ribosomal protein L17 [bacterium]|nr:50S ribosomal protein L17 [bacterium]